MNPTARHEFESTALPQLDALYGAALRLTRNSAEAEDLVQDAYVRAYRFWHTFKSGTSVRAWLFTILRNTFINRYHRSNRNRAARTDLEAQLPALGPEAAVGHPNSRVPAPDAALAARITRERIMTALESVPEDYRMAVILADLEGLAYKEIAEVMDCPIGTVMSRIYRGRRLLHKLLHDHAVELGLADPVSDEVEAVATNTVHIEDYRQRGRA
jgi:RNA polymerase sigma-70 factor (ECF subfamily)